MKRKFIRDISVNSLQVIINQVCGLLIFYVLSVFFPKKDFGEINWSLAILFTSFAVLSFGIDQVTVKKIAAGENAHAVVSLYITHVLLAGGLFYSLLLSAYFIFPPFFQHHNLLIFLGIGKLLNFFSTPFKQLANGLEKFTSLFYMSICSNLIRGISLVLLSFFSTPGLMAVIVIFIAGDAAELLLSYLISKRILKLTISVKCGRLNYFNLLKESLPQVGVVIFTSAIARFDWIILGILASSIIVAEYSFAFKVFELTTLPLLVIAPVLVPFFTRLFHAQAVPAAEKTHDLFVLLRFELIIASLAGLVLNILWVPVIDFISHGKYGAVNRYTILILSACMPFIYANNFLWTINFAKSKLKKIFYIFFVTFLINVTSDVALIPFFGPEGAATGYFIAIFVQYILFITGTDFPGLKKSGYLAVVFLLFSLASSACAMLLSNNTYVVMFVSIFFLLIMLVISGLLRPADDMKTLRRILGL